MNNENQDQRKYKRYDETFKRSAVELLLQGGKSVETAEQPGRQGDLAFGLNPQPGV